MSSFTGTDLTCIRAGRIVFDGLSFGIHAGDVLYLKGPNGSGKSSLLRVMAGLLRPTAGKISWDGRNTRDEPEDFRNQSHYIGHRDAVKGAFTVRENLSFWASMAGGNTRSATLDGALQTFALDSLADLPARFLSAGQTRRLNLARLLATSAPLWILDEPSTSLDAVNAEALRAAVQRHTAEGGLVVMATHEKITEGGQLLDLSDFQVKDAA